MANDREHLNAVDQELGRIRDRVHHQGNALGVVEATQAKHGVMIEGLARDILQVRATAATREVVDTAIAALAGQLSAAETSLEEKLEASLRETGLKLAAIQDKVDPISKGITRLVWLIITSIVLALLGLVIVQGGKLPTP